MLAHAHHRIVSPERRKESNYTVAATLPSRSWLRLASRSERQPKLLHRAKGWLILATMRYDRSIVAYHGCDKRVAKRILSGGEFKASSNEYDWLGRGIYFWEYGASRALEFAHVQKQRGHITTPAVVGAILQLGECFDLLDVKFTRELTDAYALFAGSMKATKTPMPKNEGTTPDKKRRRLDCAVLNLYLDELAHRGSTYHSVRCAFSEGKPAFPGSRIRVESHIQVAIREPACIIGVFDPYYRA
jgi:hypothetical protein